MNYVARIRRNLTAEESEQSEADALEKITSAFNRLVQDTDDSMTASSDEIAAMQKIAMAFSKLAAE